MITWYLERFHKSKYVPLDKLKGAIIKAKRIEAKRQEEIWINKMESAIESINFENQIEVNELLAQLEQSKLLIEAMEKENKVAKTMFYASISNSKKNTIVATAIQKASSRFFNEIIKLEQPFRAVLQDSERNLEIVEKQKIKYLG